MNLDFLKTTASVILSPLIAANKTSKNSLLASRDLMLKAYNEGIYHFTSDEASKAIMETNYVRASNAFTSYGKKCSFFFAGIPSFEDLAVNSLISSKDGMAKKLTAVKINLSYEELAKFNYRDRNDFALLHDGNLNFDNDKAKIEYLGLVIENGKPSYKPISEKEYETYDVDLSNLDNKKLKGILSAKLELTAIGLRKDYEYFKKSFVNALKEERTSARIARENEEIIEQNREEFIGRTR